MMMPRFQRFWKSRVALAIGSTLNLIVVLLLSTRDPNGTRDINDPGVVRKTLNENSFQGGPRNPSGLPSRNSSGILFELASTDQVVIPIEVATRWISRNRNDRRRLLWPTELVKRGGDLLQRLGVSEQLTSATLDVLAARETEYKQIQRDNLRVISNSKGDPICAVDIPATDLSKFSEGLEADLNTLFPSAKATQLREWLIGDIGLSPDPEKFRFAIEVSDLAQDLIIYSQDGERALSTSQIALDESGMAESMLSHLIPPEAAPDIFYPAPAPVSGSEE